MHTTPKDLKARTVLRLVIAVGATLITVVLAVVYLIITTQIASMESTLSWIDQVTDTCKVGVPRNHVTAILGEPFERATDSKMRKQIKAYHLERYGQQPKYMENYSTVGLKPVEQFWRLNIFYDNDDNVVFYTLYRWRSD